MEDKQLVIVVVPSIKNNNNNNKKYNTSVSNSKYRIQEPNLNSLPS